MEVAGRVVCIDISNPPVTIELLTYTKDGVACAVFTQFEKAKNAWVATRTPFILASNPELFLQFTKALNEVGYTLKSLVNDPAIRP